MIYQITTKIQAYCKLLLIILTMLGSVSANGTANANLADNYNEPGINPIRENDKQNSCDEIDPFTGKLQLHHTDILLPGNGGLDIAIARSYTSSNSQSDGWQFLPFTLVHNFGRQNVLQMEILLGSILMFALWNYSHDFA